VRNAFSRYQGIQAAQLPESDQIDKLQAMLSQMEVPENEEEQYQQEEKFMDSAFDQYRMWEAEDEDEEEEVDNYTEAETAKEEAEDWQPVSYN